MPTSGRTSSRRDIVIHPHNTDNREPFHHTPQTTPEPPPKRPRHQRVFCIPVTHHCEYRSTARCANYWSDLQPLGYRHPSAQHRQSQAVSSHRANTTRTTSQTTRSHAGPLHTDDPPLPVPEYHPLCHLCVRPPAAGVSSSKRTTRTIASRFVTHDKPPPSHLPNDPVRRGSFADG